MVSTVRLQADKSMLFVNGGLFASAVSKRSTDDIQVGDPCVVPAVKMHPRTPAIFAGWR
jgi:hypothetical protein